jgi:hypothetical protein
MAGRKRKSKDRSRAARGLKKLRAEKDDDDRRPKSQVRGSKIDAETEKASWKSKQEKWTGSKKTSGGREIDIWRQKLNAGGKSWALLPRGAWENPKPGAWKTKTGAGPPDARRKLDSGVEARKQESKKWPKADRGNGTRGAENPKLETTANENFLHGEWTPRLYLPCEIWRTNLHAILGDDHNKQIGTKTDRVASSETKLQRRNPSSRGIQNPLRETRSIGARTENFTRERRIEWDKKTVHAREKSPATTAAGNEERSQNWDRETLDLVKSKKEEQTVHTRSKSWFFI